MPVLDGGDENVPETSSGDGHTTTIPSNYQEGGLIEHAFYYFPPCYIIQMQSAVLIPGLGAQKERGLYLVLHDSGRRDSKSFVCEQVEMFLSTPPHPRHTHTHTACCAWVRVGRWAPRAHPCDPGSFCGRTRQHHCLPNLLQHSH